MIHLQGTLNPERPLLDHLSGRRWGPRFKSQLGHWFTVRPQASPSHSLGPRFSSGYWGEYQMVEEVEVWNHLDQGAVANLPGGWPGSHILPLNLSNPDLNDSSSEICS